jgi:type IV secretory pathway VirD2 relaxase
MPKRVVDLREQRATLDIASYGRRGPGHRPLTKAEVEQVSRTARRVPEVMIKVSGGARSLRGVQAHLDYIGREGAGVIETDDGAQLQEKGFEKALVKDWDLDLEEHRRHTQRAVAVGRKPPKLVHNLVFSMPKGTPAEKVQAAVRKFAAEKFALKHRYAMALHTDQGHPHMHVVVKAVSEQGERLNIRKATLREWRQDFARYLRDLGVEANATERAVRGEVRPQKATGIHRAMLRGDSTLWRERAHSVAQELARGGPSPDPGTGRLGETRREVVRGWNVMAQLLDEQGHGELATVVRRFVERMPPPSTEKQWIASELKARVARARENERAPSS